MITLARNKRSSLLSLYCHDEREKSFITLTPVVILRGGNKNKNTRKDAEVVIVVAVAVVDVSTTSF